MKTNKFEYNPSIIDSEISEEVVQYWCDEHNLNLQIVDNSSYWAGFSNKYGNDNGLLPHESDSFAYMVSMFMTGKSISWDTDIYFREIEIAFKIWDILDELYRKYDDERNVAINLFYEIFSLYKYNIEKFSLKDKSLVFRLSKSDYEKFMAVEGESKVDRLRNLLDCYFG